MLISSGSILDETIVAKPKVLNFLKKPVKKFLLEDGFIKVNKEHCFGNKSIEDGIDGRKVYTKQFGKPTKYFTCLFTITVSKHSIIICSLEEKEATYIILKSKDHKDFETAWNLILNTCKTL